MPLTFEEGGVVLGRPRKHRFTGDDHDLGEVWAASLEGGTPLMACLVAEDDRVLQAGKGPSLVYITGWGQEMATKVAGTR